MKRNKPVKKKRKSTHYLKRKGREFQKLVMQEISNLLNIPCGKDELIASREMGQAGTDIRLIGEALERFPFSVECKRQEKWAIPSWIKQAKQNQLPGTEWLLIIKSNRGNPVVIMDMDVFFEICKTSCLEGLTCLNDIQERGEKNEIELIDEEKFEL